MTSDSVTLDLAADDLTAPNENIASIALTVTFTKDSANVKAAVEGQIVFADEAEDSLSSLTLAFNNMDPKALSDIVNVTSFTISGMTGTAGEEISSATLAATATIEVTIAANDTVTVSGLTASSDTGEVVLPASEIQAANRSTTGQTGSITVDVNATLANSTADCYGVTITVPLANAGSGLGPLAWTATDQETGVKVGETSTYVKSASLTGNYSAGTFTIQTIAFTKVD